VSKFVYCSECGQRLLVRRKALKGYGRIIDIIEPHKCSKEPQELDLTPLDIPTAGEKKEEGKFVQNLNNLPVRGSIGAISTNTLQDRRREEDVKSSAPQRLLDNINSMQNTAPAHNIEEEPE